MLIYSDDSQHEEGRFNSLSLVTTKKEDAEVLVKKLRLILKGSGVTEYKWTKLKTARFRFVTQKIIDYVFEYSEILRIDTIIWDMEDSRHKDIIGIDDNENLVRMYFHLVNNVISKRHNGYEKHWNWYPDVQAGVDWDMLRSCLSSKKHKLSQNLFLTNPRFKLVNIENIIPSDSKEYPLIQIADLFAGMGAYSWGQFERFKQWESQESPQLGLNIFETKNVIFSNAEKERFPLIQSFSNKCKERSLQISLNSSGGFKTNNPNISFINFWKYEPQSFLDKAPTK